MDDGKAFQPVAKPKSKQDIESCISLLNSGKWTREITKAEALQCTPNITCRTSIWNTETECKLRHFDEHSTRSCLKNQRIFVLGDSRARQVEISFLSRLIPNLAFIDTKDPHNTVRVNVKFKSF